jgi:hypothetical protein
MKILLNYSDETLDQPVLASIIREKDVLINILRAYADGRRGEMLVEVPDALIVEHVSQFVRLMRYTLKKIFLLR